MRQLVDLFHLHNLAALAPFPNAPSRITYGLAIAWAALHLPLYREVSRRTEVAATPTLDGSLSPPPPPSGLAARVRGDTLAAAMLVAERVRDAHLSLLTHVQYSALEEWTQILLAEGECAKAAGLDHSQHLLWYARTLPSPDSSPATNAMRTSG